jgi:hypothetical protein
MHLPFASVAAYPFEFEPPYFILILMILFLVIMHGSDIGYLSFYKHVAIYL